MDERVKDVQVWLNQTYGKVSGFKKAPENGLTGWPTIYSLREGLQHELGITALAEGFGDSTKKALSAKIGDLKRGYHGNITKLVKGAFWCKGISPNNFTDSFDSDLTTAIKSLQGDAGITANGQLTVNLMAALFDMSAFVLIPGQGKSKVRQMQQYLNGKYGDELGILPCDGIYQRATNTALIFALQKAIGVAGANGNYGPGTVAATPTVSEGASGEVVRVIQYGLLVNGFYDGDCDGKYDADVASAVIAFRKFMNLPPFTGKSDLSVIKGLLTSNGNTDRDSIALDTSAQLTDKDIANFKRYGFSVVGRYLTGSVGTGASKRSKYLTSDELERITDAGLRVFPIYEDGGYEIEYFSRNRGYQDGITAAKKAAELGFPSKTTIYFAVDVDIQDGDIEGTVVPYMRGIIDALKLSPYEPGIYGTRNVCLHGEEVGMKYSFVADMSYGWSGNLGFRMPTNWAFDQFTEYPIGSTDIDQVAASGKDAGVNKFVPQLYGTISYREVAADVLKGLGKSVSVEFNKKLELVNIPSLKISVELVNSLSVADETPAITISNGKLDSISFASWLQTSGHIKGNGVDTLVNEANKVISSAGITEGNVAMEVSINNSGESELKFTCHILKAEGKQLDNELSVVITFTSRPTDLFNGTKIPNVDVPKLVTQSQTNTNAWAILTGILVVTAVSAFVGLSISTGGTAAGLLYLAQKLFSSGALAVE
ncbi:peptidoglycan-binding protein [Lactobacillus delbrueckii]|uniref:glycoside hydrolase domain-containing protein n=3 Tax=Lactobacillus delbrueckii TaxID=1584 RepID=UPI001F3759FB|nr:glycoside hydrolase domain-containing protein [Lactobacillus delbrueckii]GHN25247.1 peptidoglycan-binding protein [Lactobacillus delbrueckii]GHN28959.1 peptidoglycan-binding protein [Lactobacillus delbrueckii]